MRLGSDSGIALMRFVQEICMDVTCCTAESAQQYFD